MKIEFLEAGEIALIQQDKNGRIMQVATTTEQSKILQVFLASISKENALVQMSEEHDLILKYTIERNKLEFAIGILNEYLNKLLCTKEIKIGKPICSNTIAISVNEFLNSKK